jgi:hypothetical protein
MANHIMVTNLKQSFIPEWDPGALRIFWSHEFMEGSELAFHGVSNAIFNQLIIAPAATAVADSDSATATATATATVSAGSTTGVGTATEEGGFDTLVGVMDPRLATFYADAIAATKSRNHDVIHKLHELKRVSVEDCQMFVATVRGGNMDGLMVNDYPIPSMGPLKVAQVTKGDVNEYSGQDIENQVKEKLHGVDSGERFDELLQSSKEAAVEHGPHPTAESRLNNDLKRYTTLQIELRYACLETFAIKDRETGEVVQGSEDPRKTYHALLLENVYDAQEACIGDWTVVDIDNWLGGNKFWPKHYDPATKKTEYYS